MFAIETNYLEKKQKGRLKTGFQTTFYILSV